MADVKLNCPYCDQHLEIPEELVGQDVNCPACNEVIELAEVETPADADAGASAGQPPKTQLQPDGSVNRPCPKCRLPVHRALNRCRHCGASMEASGDEPRRYGGISRLVFVMSSLGLQLLVVGILAAAAKADIPWLALLVLPLLLIIPIVLILLRLKNLGMPWWWLFLGYLPIVNIYVAFRCFACPEGYEQTRQLDTPGKIIIGLLVVWMLLPLGLYLWLGLSMISGALPRLPSGEVEQADTPAPPEEATPPPGEPVTRFKGLTIENWETAIDSAFLNYPGWFGSVKHKGATFSVAALNENSPAGGFWGVISGRYAPTVVIMATPAADGAPIVLDTTEVRFKYANGANKLFPSAATVLLSSSVNPNGLVSKYVGARTLTPGSSPYVSVVFAGPAFDWGVVAGIILSIDGEQVIVPGRVTTVDDKTRMNAIGRGLRDTRGQQ